MKKYNIIKKIFNRKFHLDQQFVKQFQKLPNPWGFGILSDLVYTKHYSRKMEDGNYEEWYQTVERVVNGTFRMLKNYCLENNIKFDNEKNQITAKEMYKKIFHMKFTPAGRGLWSQGTDIIEKRGIYEALNNCGFISTKDIDKEFSEPFVRTMFLLMVGVGCGFDVSGENKILIKKPNTKTKKYIIDDSREGWTLSLKFLLDSYFKGEETMIFDYSKIREKGKPIKTFGGLAGGYQGLKKLHLDIINILDKEIGNKISIKNIVDIMNLIALCVVSGNIKRSAECAIGPMKSEFINLKNYELYPERSSFGYLSNNSVYAELGSNYKDIIESIKNTAEPGLVFLSNIKSYGRMNGIIDESDKCVSGLNPCFEIPLFSSEMCNLVETYPNNHNNLKEYLDTLYYSYLYGKIVSLGKINDKKTYNIIEKNRRIGISMTSVTEFISNKGIHVLKNWCEKSYNYLKHIDHNISKELKINESIKLTSIKPSGTVSLLSGSVSGCHYPIAHNLTRRVRISKDDPLVSLLTKSGLYIEPAFENKDNMVIEFPINFNKNIKTLKEINMYDQLLLQKFLQKYWSENSVSSTITFKPEEAKYLENAIEMFQYYLKSMSFLPLVDNIYPQLPYEEINIEKYNSMMSKINFEYYYINKKHYRKSDSTQEKYCDIDKCSI